MSMACYIVYVDVTCYDCCMPMLKISSARFCHRVLIQGLQSRGEHGAKALCAYTYVYIYIYIERERYTYINIYIYIYRERDV